LITDADGVRRQPAGPFILVRVLSAVAAWGFFILTFYWIALWLVVGVILLLVSTLRRSANRFVKPS